MQTNAPKIGNQTFPLLTKNSNQSGSCTKYKEVYNIPLFFTFFLIVFAIMKGAVKDKGSVRCGQSKFEEARRSPA